jgi:DNA-nicking Smr family endonuclease
MRRARSTTDRSALEVKRSPPAVVPPVADDRDLFTRAMDGVVPLPAARRERVDEPGPASAPRAPMSDGTEALGEITFDVTDTGESVEGAVTGLDARVVRQLRRGEFPRQAYLDLHGLTAAEARPAVERFVVEAVRGGRRCVLLVHGRGHNSKDNVPVLKTNLVGWLVRGAVSRMVLAFTSARPPDGGAGALYVLLRRDRRRRVVRGGAGTTT